MLRIVEAKHGHFMVFDNDRYVGRSLIELGEFAELQAQFFQAIIKPEAVVVEVGSNIGAHTVPIAKKAAMVHAFEPQRRVYNVLCANMALNELDNVECYRAAAGARKEVVRVPSMDFDLPVNNFGAFQIDNQGEASDIVTIMPVTIPCDFLKIDVEGWEVPVIHGAADMIRECHPVIYTENDRAEHSDELIGALQELGYRCYWHVTPLYRRANHNGCAEDIFHILSVDMVCLPNGASCPFVEAKIGERPVLEYIEQ